MSLPTLVQDQIALSDRPDRALSIFSRHLLIGFLACLVALDSAGKILAYGEIIKMQMSLYASLFVKNSFYNDSIL